MGKLILTNSATSQTVTMIASSSQMARIMDWCSDGELTVTVDADGKPIDMIRVVQIGSIPNYASADPSFVLIDPSPRDPLPRLRPMRIPIRPLAENSGGKFDAKHEIDDLKYTVRQLTDYVNELRRDVDRLQGCE